MQNAAMAIRATRAATPPIVPPAIAPVLLNVDAAAGVAVDDGVEELVVPAKIVDGVVSVADVDVLDDDDELLVEDVELEDVELEDVEVGVDE